MTAQHRTSLSGVRDVAAPPRPAIELDDLDLTLLRMLAENSRMSQRALAKELGVSTPTVSERMSRLERANVIRAYTVDIDWAAVGLHETVFLSMTASTDHDVSQIMTQLWDIPEVQDVHLVTGDLDLLISLRVKDNSHLRTLLMNRIWQIPGTQRISTMTSMAEMPAKNYTAELLSSLRRERSA